MVARDKDGKLLLAGVRKIKATWAAEISEAAVALFVVELMIRYGYRYIHLEGDALSVVMAIDQKAEGSSPIHLIYDKLFSMLSCFDGFLCSYVSRCGNTVAHAVARWDTGIANERICMEPFSQELLALVDPQ